MNEITYLKRYYDYLNKDVSKFATSDLIRAEAEEIYNESMIKLSKDDKFYQVKLSALKAERQQNLEAVETCEKRMKK